MDKEKLVYVPMAVDTVHPGHMNIIKTAASLGKVMVGLFSDEAIASYKKTPLMHYEQRKCVIENIKGVDVVVKQETRDYEPNLIRYRPDYMVHGTDWRTGPLADVRERAIKLMAEWGGEVIEPEYTEGISSTALKSGMQTSGVLSQERQKGLKRLIELKPFTYIAGVADPYSASVLDGIALAEDRKPKKNVDALYIEARQPNNLPMDASRYLAGMNEIASVTTLPLVVCDAPFRTQRELEWGMKEAQRLGGSAVAFSSFGNQALTLKQKMSIFKEKRVTSDFLALIEMEATAAREPVNVEESILSFMEYGVSAVILHGSQEEVERAGQFLQNIAEKEVPLIAATGPAIEGGIQAAGFRGVLGVQLARTPILECLKLTAEAFLRLE